jgi:hypothetical protein
MIVKHVIIPAESCPVIVGVRSLSSRTGSLTIGET